MRSHVSTSLRIIAEILVNRRCASLKEYSMKTITEFYGANLGRALKKTRELTTAGKTAEEIPQAIGEEFKLEGDKLKLFMQALEVIKIKSDQLKRVVVIQLAENDKLPNGATKKDEYCFLPEYFPAPPRADKGPHRGGHRDRDDDKRRGKRGKRGKRGADRGRRPDDHPRGPRTPSLQVKTGTPKIIPVVKTPAQD
jgi:hypothetical protein